MTEQKGTGKSFFLEGDGNIGILLLHGWTSPPEEFLPLAKFLNSSGYAVLAPLLRGHGTFPEDLLGVEWKDWLEDARKALEELKKSSDHIIVGGISMGGDLAMQLCEDEAVSGIFVMGASVKYRFHFFTKAALGLMGAAKTYRKKYYPRWLCKNMGERNVYPYYPVESAREVMKLAEATRKFLPRIKKPILIMQSTIDHMVSKKSPQMILDGVKSEVKEVFWVKDVYHVFVADPKVWEKIENFIEKNTKTQS